LELASANLLARHRVEDRPSRGHHAITNDRRKNMAFIDAENGRLVYFEHHAGSKRPIVLIHGWAMSGRVWDSTTDALRALGHEVVVIDHRGCGRSDKDFADNSIAAIARDVVSIINKTGLQDVVLNGWSLGGAVAVEAARLLGPRAGGLVLTCAASPRYTQAEGFPHGGLAEDVRGIAGALGADRAGFFHGLSQAVCAKPVGQPVIDWFWSLFMESGPGVGQSITDLADLDQRTILAALDIPLLSIVGSHDSFTPPEIGTHAAELARNGRLLRFEDCGHAPFLEDHVAYQAALAGFLRELDTL